MKYVIDIPNNTLQICLITENTKDHHPYIERKQVEDLTPYAKPDEDEIRRKAHEEAWEFARTVKRMSIADCGKCFETYTGIFDLNYSEAKAKYDAWRKQKDEIRMGDEVIYNSHIKGIVLMPETEEKYGTILTGDFITVSHDELKKTGRHFPEVAELLKNIREE